MKLELNETVDDAVLLIDYAARHGKTVSDDIREKILDVEAVLEASKTPSAQQKQEFWDSFTKLANDLKPVTPERIRYTTGRGVTGLRRRRYQVPIYVGLSMVVLAGLVFLQLFWVGGASLASDVHTNLDSFAKIRMDIADLESKLEPGEITSADLDEKYSELRNVFAKLLSDQSSLHAWNQIWAKAEFMKPAFKGEPYSTFDALTAANVDLSSARMFLNGVYAYALPMLYGLLGSCFYVLRTMSTDLRKWKYDGQSATNYLLRVVLGPLAGLAVSLFMIRVALPDDVAMNIMTQLTATEKPATEVDSSIKQLSELARLGPLAAAFIVGYGVELLFSFMDRIIGAFTGKAQQ